MYLVRPRPRAPRQTPGSELQGPAPACHRAARLAAWAAVCLLICLVRAALRRAVLCEQRSLITKREQIVVE